MNKLGIKVFLDSASIGEMCDATEVDGFTTNPSLMRKAGVKDYESWAKSALAVVSPKPISFEVLADDLDEMERQAHRIAAWGPNVYVKIPIVNTKSEPTWRVIEDLSIYHVQVNVTAVMNIAQIREAALALGQDAHNIISVFAGRIADTGRDPCSFVADAVLNAPDQVLWASTREIYNIFQAASAHCHIITISSDILRKLNFIGKELDQLSLDTVKQFYADAQAAGYTL